MEVQQKILKCSTHGTDLDYWNCKECADLLTCEDCGYVHPDNSCQDVIDAFN